MSLFYKSDTEELEELVEEVQDFVENDPSILEQITDGLASILSMF